MTFTLNNPPPFLCISLDILCTTLGYNHLIVLTSLQISLQISRVRDNVSVFFGSSKRSSNNIKNETRSGLERWLSGPKHMLLLRRSWVWFPASRSGSSQYSSSKGSSAHGTSPRTQAHTHIGRREIARSLDMVCSRERGMTSTQEDQSRGKRSEWAAGVETQQSLESTGFNSQSHTGEIESLRGK